MITIYQLHDSEIEFTPVGRIEGGEIIEDDGTVERLVPEYLLGEDYDEDRLIERYDGPKYVAAQTESAEAEKVAKDPDKWVPYIGPQGGEGWQNARTGDVRYQQEPPGAVGGEYDEDYWSGRDASSHLSEQDREAVVASIRQFDPDAHEYGTWRGGMYRDSVEVGSFVSIYEPGYNDFGELLGRVVSRDGDAFTVVDENGDVQIIGETDDRTTRLADVYEIQSWREPDPEPEETDDGDDDEPESDPEPEPEPDPDPPTVNGTHPLAPKDREQYEQALDRIIADTSYMSWDEAQERGMEKMTWAAEVVGIHYRQRDDIDLDSVNVVEAEDMHQIRQTVADIEELHDAGLLDGLEALYLKAGKDLDDDEQGINATYEPLNFFGNYRPTIKLGTDIYHNNNPHKSHGEYVTDERHALWHELAHHRHITTLREKGYSWEEIGSFRGDSMELTERIWDRTDRETVAEEVAWWGWYDPLEFAAEAYAWAAAGRELSPEIKDAVAAIHGELPEQ